MKYALAIVARLNAQAQARWTFFGSLSQPKIHRPRNVDSTKKATIGTGAGQPVPRDAILAALREIDYTGEFAAEGSGEPTRRE